MRFRLREDKTIIIYIGVKKAYDTVWHDGLWLELWNMAVKGRVWQKMYGSSRSSFARGRRVGSILNRTRGDSKL